MSKEEIKKYKRELKKCGEKLCIGTDKKGSLESVLNKELSKISDIYEGIFPAILVGHIIGCHDKLDAIMNNLIDRTEGLEEGIIGLVENNADSLIDDIGKTNNAIGVDWQGMKEYTQGGIYSNTDMQSACVNGEINSNFHNNNKEYVDEVWKREAELIKKAEEREEGGYWKILNGFLEIGGGIKTIVVSHGSCLFLGLSEIGMGVSNWSEGMDDIYYGSQGDITSKSTNYGRSIVCYFGGDYETYSMLENAVVFASSAFSPIYSQYKTGQLTTRSFLTAVGKEAISTEAGNIASGIVYDATDNRTLSMLAGMTTSNLTSKGLCNLDKKYGWSFGKVADTSTPLEGMKGSDDSKLDADVGDVEVGAKKNTQDVENNVGQEYNNSGSGFSKSGKTSPKGLIGHDFEDYLTKNIGGEGSFSVGGRDFDGGIGNRWWEAKSGQYWDMLESNPNKLAKFKSDMGDRLRIATENGATYELFSNTPIPSSIKQWLDKKGIAYTELLD